MVVVRLPQVLRLYAGGKATVEAHGSTVAAVLDALVSDYPAVVRRVRDEQGLIRQHVNVFVGDERAVLDTPVKDGQEVTILPAISGGACTPELRWPTWFESVASETVHLLASLVGRQRFPAGSALFIEGDPATQVLVIQRGDVKVTAVARDGREVILDVLGAGAIVGELAAMDGGQRSATAVALTEVEVAAIPSGSFREVAESRSDLLAPLLHEVIRRLRLSDRRQLEFGGDALGRVCARLTEIAERQGDRTNILLPVSQSDLAAWTGLSREAVVKALATLRRLGWVATEGRQFVLLEPDEIRLRAHA